PDTYSLSLHDALPIFQVAAAEEARHRGELQVASRAVRRLLRGRHGRRGYQAPADRPRPGGRGRFAEGADQDGEGDPAAEGHQARSEEHTSELQSLAYL